MNEDNGVSGFGEFMLWDGIIGLVGFLIVCGMAGGN